MMHRRKFLGLAAGLATSTGGLLIPAAAQAAEEDFKLDGTSRQVDLYRPDTRERLTMTYLADGAWTPDAYTKLCWLLRDTHTRQYVRMDPTLIAVLDWTQRYLAKYGYTEPLHILSGFRSRKTNQAIEGAAKNSQHLYGKAIDFRVPGLDSAYLGKLMAWLSQGGVGIYERNGFVHVDTGSVRIWHGPRRRS